MIILRRKKIRQLTENNVHRLDFIFLHLLTFAAFRLWFIAVICEWTVRRREYCCGAPTAAHAIHSNFLFRGSLWMHACATRHRIHQPASVGWLNNGMQICNLDDDRPFCCCERLSRHQPKRHNRSGIRNIFWCVEIENANCASIKPHHSCHDYEYYSDDDACWENRRAKTRCLSFSNQNSLPIRSTTFSNR